MNITRTNFSAVPRHQGAPVTPQDQGDSAPSDSISFGQGFDKAKDVAMFGALGVTPGFGAIGNTMIAWGTAVDDATSNKSTIRPAAALAGAAANVGGTITGAVGLFTGNSTTQMVGLGLLGFSGLTSAVLIANAH